jgi:hypothetical protein
MSELKPVKAGINYGERSPKDEWWWSGTGSPDDDWVPVTAEPTEIPTQLAKPAVLKHHAWTMDKASMAFLTDLTAYPGLNYGQILIYPTAELVKKYNLT